jgi:hypothetical protein
MFDVFTEQIEVLIKEGIANLYWYKADLQKAWLRSGVPRSLTKSIADEVDHEGKPLTKRQQMNRLYEELRGADFNVRLEISRNFVRTLTEHKNFVPQDPRHRIEVAERSALKLREALKEEEEQKENAERARRRAATAIRRTYEQDLRLSEIRSSGRT